MDKNQINTSYITDSKVETSNREYDNSPIYEIMHMDRVVASVSKTGIAEIYDSQFMPYDLYLDPTDDFDIRFNNLRVFEYWCASRVLTLDRVYAKEILNSIGAVQAPTDRDRAKISQSYHCVSLIDVFWVRIRGEDITFNDLNLYDNSLKKAFVELPLFGRQMTVTNQELAQDLATKGYFPKAWVRDVDSFSLLKDGGETVVRKELLASAIAQCFDVDQVIYLEDEYDGQIVTRSKLVTSKEYSIVTKAAFEIYAQNHDQDAIEECIKLDSRNYYGMNIVDYLVGNTDRHQENWGLLIDNKTNLPLSLHPLMDFNQSFQAYDTLEGANCLTTNVRMSQREAAIEAVRAIGLNQLCEMDMQKFGDMKKEAEMFRRRLAELKQYAQKNK